MREIKFRVWDGENMISPDSIGRSGYAHWKSNSIPNFSNELMQYTGLRDKHGAEVYEGDWVRAYGGTGKIIFLHAMFAWDCSEDVVYALDQLSKGEIEFEVIGNIYENPEAAA